MRLGNNSLLLGEKPTNRNEKFETENQMKFDSQLHFFVFPKDLGFLLLSCIYNSLDTIKYVYTIIVDFGMGLGLQPQYLGHDHRFPHHRNGFVLCSVTMDLFFFSC